MTLLQSLSCWIHGMRYALAIGSSQASLPHPLFRHPQTDGHALRCYLRRSRRQPLRLLLLGLQALHSAPQRFPLFTLRHEVIPTLMTLMRHHRRRRVMPPFLLPFLLRLWAIQTSILRIGAARARGAAAPRNRVTANALSSLTRDFSIVSMTEMGCLAGLL